ncbi:MAG: hypothetical protein ACRCV7_01945 [Culicoidibacterales bacterium]
MSFDLSNLFLTGKQTEIISESLDIKENILKFDNLTLQLSNVSMLRVGIKDFQIPWRAALTCIIFLFLAMQNNLFLISVFFLAISGVAGYYIWKHIEAHNNTKYYLKFFLNSGEQYSLYKKEITALKQVKDVVEEAFNNKGMQVSYHIHDSEITYTENNVSGDGKVSVNIGTQGNVMVDQSTKNSNDTNNYANSNNTVTGNYHVEGNTTIETQRTVSQFLAEYNCSWTDIANELEVTLAKISDNSQEKRIAQEMLMAAKNRDENSFLNIFKNNKSILRELFVNTTSSLAGGLLVQLTMHLIGK